MEKPPLVLGSASPRRRRLVGWLGVPATTASAEIDEDLSVDMPPDELAVSLALRKAEVIRAECAEGIILAFDTIVVADCESLGKPENRDEARTMVKRLAGRTHDVVTGVAIVRPGREPETFSVTTPVQMKALTDEEIERWVASDECLGCAGAYNIEHHLATVEDSECFNNVAGMPLCHVYAALASGEMAPEGLVAPFEACNEALGRHCLLGGAVCAPGER